MGFLLALDLPTVLALNKVSKGSSDSHSAAGNKNLSRGSGRYLPKHHRSTENVQGTGTDAHEWSKPRMKVTEESNIRSGPQPETCTEDHVADACPNDDTIQQCLRRSLSSIKSDPEKKLCLVKINNATSQVVSGVKYTVAFEAKDEITGKSFNSEAVIVSQPWASQEPAVVDFKFSPST